MNRVFTSFILLLFVSCSPISRQLKKKIRGTEEQFQDHVGFALYNPATRETIYEHNSARYFTPASNTKIFTLFASLKILGDSIPGLKYSQRGDSLIFCGTGDPSFLYASTFDNERVYTFLKSSPGKLYYSSPNFFSPPFGPGWSWEDYDYAFSSERSPFPIYGNVVEIEKYNGNHFRITPGYFQQQLELSTDSLPVTNVVRSFHENKFTYFPGSIDRVRKWTKPFITDTSLVVKLLSDTLQRVVKTTMAPPHSLTKTIYSVPSDSLYKVMMQESDNFIAEQLLVVCAGVLTDSLKPEIAIKYVTKNYLQDLPDKPVWNDGSGLSRYNLFTPRSLVSIWDKIYQLVPQERLFRILAVGGVNGTLRNSYKADRPYIFAKTGTLTNVHCLSGYLVTKKGKTLIFSFMNTNFTAPTREIRTRMEEILATIRDHY